MSELESREERTATTESPAEEPHADDPAESRPSSNSVANRQRQAQADSAASGSKNTNQSADKSESPADEAMPEEMRAAAAPINGNENRNSVEEQSDRAVQPADKMPRRRLDLAQSLAIGAKTAIVQCLSRLELGSPEVFLRGLHHVQMEPAYGGPVDTAVELRSESAVSTGPPNAGSIGT